MVRQALQKFLLSLFVLKSRTAKEPIFVKIVCVRFCYKRTEWRKLSSVWDARDYYFEINLKLHLFFFFFKNCYPTQYCNICQYRIVALWWEKMGSRSIKNLALCSHHSLNHLLRTAYYAGALRCAQFVQSLNHTPAPELIGKMFVFLDWMRRFFYRINFSPIVHVDSPRTWD